MITQDLHVHTTFCDGKNTPEEMVLAAISQGMTCIGFSGHSYVPFDAGYCMAPGAQAYRKEIARLKSVYGDKIRILCGVEQEYYSLEDTRGYDYVIGSVHYVKAGEDYIPVDDTPEKLIQGAKRYYGGDLYGLIRDYYQLVADVANRTHCQIVGHFDLISKFSEKYDLFDRNDPRYIAAWTQAADALLETGCTFEINTGAISRNWRTAPYPDMPILAYLKQRGAQFILSGDSHSRDTLCYAFDRWESELNQT